MIKEYTLWLWSKEWDGLDNKMELLTTQSWMDRDKSIRLRRFIGLRIGENFNIYTKSKNIDIWKDFEKLVLQKGDLKKF